LNAQYNDPFFLSGEFQSFFSSSPRSLVMRTDAPDFTILAVSDLYLALVHKSRNELLGNGLFSVFPGSKGDPNEQNSVYNSFLRVIDTRKKDELPIFKYEIYLAEEDRYETHYWTNCNEPILDKDGKVRYIINTTTNITAQIQDRLSREESESRFRRMADGTNVFIALSDESSKAVYFNPAWSRLSGYTHEQLIGKGWIEIIHPEDRKFTLERFFQSSIAKQHFQSEFRVRNKNGNYKWLMLDSTVRHHSDGTFAGYVSAGMDVTSMKREEERKNDFIGMVSHEMKTPLTSLKGYIDLADSMALRDKNELQAGVLKKAKRQISKMTGMINGFLEVSRLESGQININKKKFSLTALIEEVREEFAPTKIANRIIFKPFPIFDLTADKEKLGQVISNLISNAVKYGAQEGDITVSARDLGGSLAVSVHNTGETIPAEHIPKLFDRYYRVDNASNKTVAGFGIGLYLCAEIMKYHQGRIWVESQQVAGTTFSFSIPYESALHKNS